MQGQRGQDFETAARGRHSFRFLGPRPNDRLSHPVKEAAYRAAIHLNPQRGVERLAHFLHAALGIALMRAPQERLRLGVCLRRLPRRRPSRRPARPWAAKRAWSRKYCGRLKGTVYLRKNSSTDRSDPAIFSTIAAIFSALLFPPAVDLFIHLNIA